MKVNKVKTFKIDKGYTVSLVNINGVVKVAVGTEGHGPEYMLSLPEFEPEPLCDGPGGTMSILNVPDKRNDLVSIMGLFPPFIGFDAGVYYHLWSENGWSEHKVIDLPFAHRMEWMEAEGVPTLIVACVSKYKENPSDWSNPGVLYAATLDSHNHKWEMTPILEGLTRHHGMLKTLHNGVETLLVTAAEGVFCVYWNTLLKKWVTEKWLDIEVSEIAMIDLDGDGINELITIEPFHGTKMVIYKFLNNYWEPRFETYLSFGHGLHANFIDGEPTILVGNRATGKELLAFKPISPLSRQMDRIVLETDAGPTQIVSSTIGNNHYIISSNQNKSEIALYQVNN